MCEEVRGRKIGREIKCRKEGTLSRFGGKKTNEGERRGEEGDEEDCGGKFGRRKKTKESASVRKARRESKVSARGRERMEGGRGESLSLDNASASAPSSALSFFFSLSVLSLFF